MGYLKPNLFLEKNRSNTVGVDKGIYKILNGISPKCNVAGV